MKKLFTLIAVIGGFCILGAAGMADTYNGEQMFTRLIVGILLSLIGCTGTHICNVKAEEQIIAKRLKLLHTSV